MNGSVWSGLFSLWTFSVSTERNRCPNCAQPQCALPEWPNTWKSLRIFLQDFVYLKCAKIVDTNWWKGRLIWGKTIHRMVNHFLLADWALATRQLTHFERTLQTAELALKIKKFPRKRLSTYSLPECPDIMWQCSNIRVDTWSLFAKMIWCLESKDGGARSSLLPTRSRTNTV